MSKWKAWGHDGQEKLYTSSAWLALRKRLHYERPWDELLMMYDILYQSEELDHIIPIRFGGAKLDVRNLWMLSSRIHRRKTAIEASLPPDFIPFELNSYGERVPTDRLSLIYKLETAGLEYRRKRLKNFPAQDIRH